MNIQCKGFNATTAPDLAAMMGKWFEENKGIEIISVTQSQSTVGNAQVTLNSIVVYRK